MAAMASQAEAGSLASTSSTAEPELRYGGSSSPDENLDKEDEEEPLLKEKKRRSMCSNDEPRCENCWGLLTFTTSLQEAFGTKLLLLLAVSQHLLKGFVHSFTEPAVQYLYAAYNVPGPQMQVFKGVTQVPWAMKPILGLMSDVLPINGYNKAPYVLLAALLGTGAVATIGVVPQALLNVSSLVVCLFFLSLQLSVTDLLTEAKYAEQMQCRPKDGPALMTYVWFGMQVGGLLATLLIGSVLTSYGPKMPFLLCVLPCSFIIVPVLKGYLQEEYQTGASIQAARQAMFRQKEACFLCFLMLVCTLVLTFLGIRYSNISLNACAALVCGMVITIAFSVLLRPEIAKVTVWGLVQTSVGCSISGASFYFYTDSADAYADGPHFSKFFFTTVLGLFGAVFSLLGIYSYQKCASSWTYRRLYLVSNIAISVLSLTDLVFFLRLNKRFGIPDEFFVLGSSVFTSILSQWQWMPSVVIMSQLCPKGMEATMYAMLAGCHNLGNTVAASSGAWLLQALNCQPSGAHGEDEQFKHLWVASAISSVLPAAMVVLLPWFIPDKKQTEKLLPDGDISAIKGSLWRRWTGADD
eukprot:TRINITY_DN24754_c0_g1_i1.p1 TRINITY_DN24754_c0_g1~~TRINITY_DN24754_c0_g1_i1.p1  ORF type:complete len:581 (-),score=102.31 TRINITY_DN24754_c0_g1_i1:89-1831(-)